jgi:fumarylacetoacetate (FAA) hydrolase
MKLGTLKDGTRDGALLLVSRDLKRTVLATGVVKTMQGALDNWAAVAPRLQELADQLERGTAPGITSFDPTALMAPLPRAYQFLDGSAYLNHVILVRKSRGAEVPPTLRTDPLMYQGGSDAFLGPCAPIEAMDEAHGIDFESEVAVITDDVPMGVTAEEALAHIKLVAVLNDVSLRNLIPDELAKGFGFIISKPASSFAPVFVTPDELGSAWRGGRIHAPLKTWINGKLFGDPEAGEMHFHFGELIAHVARTRHLRAGTILGSGTVSNEDRKRGSSCLVEKRMLEKLDSGAFATSYMKFGDRVEIEMTVDGKSVFGRIDQRVVKYKR